MSAAGAPLKMALTPGTLVVNSVGCLVVDHGRNSSVAGLLSCKIAGDNLNSHRSRLMEEYGST